MKKRGAPTWCFAGNKIGETSIKILSDGLKVNKSLTKLDISG
jgi:hypothetical protein